MTLNTPVGSAPADQCGRVVFSDIHVSSDSAPEKFEFDDETVPPFPTLCASGALTPQEQALEFLFFDLNACVQDDSTPVAPPR